MYARPGHVVLEASWRDHASLVIGVHWESVASTVVCWSLSLGYAPIALPYTAICALGMESRESSGKPQSCPFLWSREKCI